MNGMSLRAASRRRPGLRFAALVAPGALFIVIGLLVPLLAVVVFSFWRTESYELYADWSLDNYRTLVEDPVSKDRLLKKLIGDHEPPYAEQWRGLPQDFAHKLLAGIVAFELEVTKMECKLKLNQHRPESHAALRASYAGGNDNERALGAWMARLGLGEA